MQNCKGIAYENSLSFVGTNDIKVTRSLIFYSFLLLHQYHASLYWRIFIHNISIHSQHVNFDPQSSTKNITTCHCFQINLPKFSILLSNPKLSQIIIRDTWTSIFIYVPRLSLSPVPSRSPSGVQATTREQREKETKKEENAPRVFYRS